MPPRDGTSSRRTTIYDLAKLAGTSPSAVSSVLNGSWKKRRISQKLAEKIMRLAEEQGYSVNIQASVLRRDRSNIIGMLIPKYDNRYFGAIAEQFETMARARGLFPVITCTQRDPDLEIAAAKELLSYQVDCLIATGATDPDRISALCSASGVRTINLDLPGTKAPSVISDNFAGARDLASLILDHQEAPSAPLLFIGGRESDHNTSERVRGFIAAHEDRGIGVNSDLILTCGYAADKAEAALSTLDGPIPRGFFVNSTITLEGVMRWLYHQSHEARAPIRYGCFDWDPFAALLPANVGMARQDVISMLELTFRLLDADPNVVQSQQVPCVLTCLV